MKVCRAIGMLSISTAFIVILGTAGSSDLGIITFGQSVVRCLGALAIGIVGIIIMAYEPKAKPQTVAIETPEQTYEKCCYCPHYATCTKSLEEVLKC
jgi:hypothetical protein